MSNVHTLRDIENRGAVGSTKVNIPPGHRLSSIRELELEKRMNDHVQAQANASKKISQLNATNTRLRSSERSSHTEHKAEREKYSAKIKSLKSLIKTLEKEATLAQKASFSDKITILSLEAKIIELEDKLEDLKLEQEDSLLHTSFFDSDVVKEVTGTPGKQKDSKLPDWIDDNLKSLVYELGLENKVKEIEKKKIAKEDLLEQTQKTSSESEVVEGTRSCLSASGQSEPSSKNQKTGLPPIKLCLLDMDEVTEHESSRNVGHPAMTWTFAMVVTGKSGTGKTNLFANLVLGDKNEYVQKGEKGGSRYIRCDDLIICGYHPDEPKWAYVRYIYNMISKDPRVPYYEDISFSYIPPEKIPSTRAFSPKRIVFNSGSSHEDISKIIRRYTDDVKNASMVINSYLRKSEFVVFDLTRPEDDPLAIRLRFDTPLNLQKEIEARQKRKEKSFSTNE
ncbi:hypothetical protein C1645_813864 [Glomus cerebriforme]|uniref:Uncharacterized protein n=1 Tax=Glomus cerebriforme TaxID=658196 RepID=A0A397THB1_9GLOM|nr:hypothetical protein C1645_813864 [Glomus cerebriforme]